jgi:oxygen-independent coproporphyrinogen-3 oxidase
MAGIYIHIPFCKKACHYCNFHFSVSIQQKDEMIKSICREAELRQEYVTERIDTIYFGGGTPSLLTAMELRLLLEKLKELFLIDENAEVTLEANPDDLNSSKPAEWKSIGINRLSIGVQSFFDQDLQWMNRAHTAEQALRNIQVAQEIGLHNITIDLIYGTPTLTDEQWKQNIKTALSLNIPHLSCYALTVEPKTALQKMIEQHKTEDIDADKQGRQFELLMEWMEAAGYEHYEISNFAQPGKRSKHNSSYWEGKHYLGLGPSAHSFNGFSRQWNISNNALYINQIKQNMVPYEIEQLTSTQQLNEYIMTSLRTSEGISLFSLIDKWGEVSAEKIAAASEKYRSQGMIFKESDHLILTRKGKLFADAIAADLFM